MARRSTDVVVKHQQHSGKIRMELIFFIVTLVCLSPEASGQDPNQDRINEVFYPKETKDCVCVPHYLCLQGNNTLNTGGFGVFDIKEGGVCNSLEVCCNKQEIRDEPIERLPLPNKGCGYRHPDGLGFRVTGSDDVTQFGEFPWMVAILAEKYSAGASKVFPAYKCGGSLIHPQAVLTAAHCVADSETKYKIRAGEWDSEGMTEVIPHQDRDVESISIHSEFHNLGLYNDVAVLFLAKPVTIGETVNTICLPERDIVIPSGTRCLATGWGRDIFGKGGKYRAILKKVELPIVDSSTCQEQLRKTRLSQYFVLDKSFICAGGEGGNDSCTGDGGGPLVCPISGQKDRYQQIGIVAWGIGCGEIQVPGTYANVPKFLHWIDEEIRNKNLDSSSYRQ